MSNPATPKNRSFFIVLVPYFPQRNRGGFLHLLSVCSYPRNGSLPHNPRSVFNLPQVRDESKHFTEIISE